MTETAKPDVNEPLLAQLGIRPAFVDAEGPPVEKDVLRRYVRGHAGAEERKMVEELVSKFRSWFHTFGEVLKEQ